MVGEDEKDVPKRPLTSRRRPPPLDEAAMMEEILKNSENDYLTVLAIARRARQIQDDEEHYGDALDTEKATTIALREFLAKRFRFYLQDDKSGGKK